MDQFPPTQLECPACLFRFEDPDGTLEEGAEFLCPQCSLPFKVTSVTPATFGPIAAWHSGLDCAAHLLVQGISGRITAGEIPAIVEKARKQGCSGITLSFSFEDALDEAGLLITIDRLEYGGIAGPSSAADTLDLGE